MAAATAGGGQIGTARGAAGLVGGMLLGVVEGVLAATFRAHEVVAAVGKSAHGVGSRVRALLIDHLVAGGERDGPKRDGLRRRVDVLRSSAVRRVERDRRDALVVLAVAVGALGARLRLRFAEQAVRGDDGCFAVGVDFPADRRARVVDADRDGDGNADAGVLAARLAVHRALHLGGMARRDVQVAAEIDVDAVAQARGAVVLAINDGYGAADGGVA